MGQLALCTATLDKMRQESVDELKIILSTHVNDRTTEDAEALLRATHNVEPVHASPRLTTNTVSIFY